MVASRRMLKIMRYPRSVVVDVLLLISSSALATPTVELVNNQPFPISLPIELRSFYPGDGKWQTADAHPVQQFGSNLILVANLPASSRSRLNFSPVESKATHSVRFSIRHEPAGVGLTFSG